jgi:hypothetical protein
VHNPREFEVAEPEPQSSVAAEVSGASPQVTMTAQYPPQHFGQ